MKFFIALALRRLTSRLALSSLLVFSIALTVGVLVCVPVFSNAVTMRLMQQELSERAERFDRPAFAIRSYVIPKGIQMSIQDSLDRRDWHMGLLQKHLNLPVVSSYVQVESRSLHLRSIKENPLNRHQEDEIDMVRSLFVPDIGNHAKVVTGVPYGEPPSNLPADTMAVWVETHYARIKDLQVGDLYTLGGTDVSKVNRIQVQVVGTWEATDRHDIFWYKDPIADYNLSFLITRAEFEKRIYPQTPELTSFTFWYFLLDETRINLDQSEYYLTGLKDYSNEVGRNIQGARVDVSPMAELGLAQKRKVSLTFILTGFSAPLLVMLVYFVISMSTMTARFQRREVALLSSRGGTSRQILQLILLESFFILFIALPLGLLIGYGLATLMGYSVSFLQFEIRSPLGVRIESTDWRMVIAGLAVGVIARMWATWRASSISLVAYERQRARTIHFTTWARIVFIIILTAVTYYAYRQLTLKGTLGFVSWQMDDPSNDPLLLAAPTLFLFTGPLVAVELFILLMRPISWIAKILPTYTGYLGLTTLGREGSQYRAPAYLLVLCLTLGVFYASVALSADIWLVERRRYEVGADLTFVPKVKRDTSSGAGNITYDDSTTALIPLSEYKAMPGVDTVTLVGDFTAVAQNQSLSSLRVLVIDRLTFPQSTYFRRDFSKHSLGDMLNRLGSIENGVIVPRSVLTLTGLAIGDQLNLDMVLATTENYKLRFQIVDTYDYFPTVYGDKPAVLIDASYLNAQIGGSFPGSIWIRLKPGADTAVILSAVEKMRVEPTYPRDLRDIIKTDQSRLEHVGMFGLLSISFVAGAVLAGIGILVYCLSALMERAQRFAIMRAMGMRRREVIGTVLLEYVITLAFAVTAGIGLGILASRLYVPYFPVTDSPGIPVPPFTPYIDWIRAYWMTAVVSVALIVIVGGIVIRVARARIFEILRMGGWE